MVHWSDIALLLAFFAIVGIVIYMFLTASG